MAGQDNRFKPQEQEPLIDVQALVKLGASFGPFAINRACGNWRGHRQAADRRSTGSCLRRRATQRPSNGDPYGNHSLRKTKRLAGANLLAVVVSGGP